MDDSQIWMNLPIPPHEQGKFLNSLNSEFSFS